MKDSELPQSELLDSADFSNNYSARNKKVAVQLNEYLYYHGPSDASHTDRRLIGRRKLIDKLASLISSSEVATGVYLVSGFRGSGKTSIVNSVISKFNQILKTNVTYIISGN